MAMTPEDKPKTIKVAETYKKIDLKDTPLKIMARQISLNYGMAPSGNMANQLLNDAVIELLIDKGLISMNEVAAKAIEIAPRFGIHKVK